MKVPLIERSIRWKILFAMIGISLVLCTGLVLVSHHEHQLLIESISLIAADVEGGSAIYQALHQGNHRALEREVLMVLALMALTTGAMMLISLRLTNPLRQLARQALEISRGNFGEAHKQVSHDHDEIGTLSMAITTMAKEIEKKQKALAEAAGTSSRNELFLNSVIENIPLIVYVKTFEDGRHILDNKSVEQVMGLSREDIVGKTEAELFGPEQAALFHQSDVEALEHGGPLSLPLQPMSLPDGQTRILKGTKVVIKNEDGSPHYVLGLHEDVTDIQRAAEERELLFDLTHDFLGIGRMDSTITDVNPALLKTLGYEREEVIGSRFLDLIHPGDLEKAKSALGQLETGTPLKNFECRFLKKDGTSRLISTNAASRPDLNIFYSIGRDITELRAVEEESIRIATEEQERIARDLHDGLGQTMAGLAFKAKLIEKMLQDGTTPKATQASELVELASRAAIEARSLARGLDPVELEKGLPMALEQLARTTQNFFNITCTVECFLIDPIGKVAAANLYRIAQEAVNNAVRHGKAKQVTIRLLQDQYRTELVVSDDGKGMTEKPGESDGNGQRIMAHRARMIGGALTIMPGPTGGLVITCTIYDSRNKG